ncbi:hypothetical protein ACQ86N_15600 [Puia sp. P3]
MGYFYRSIAQTTTGFSGAEITSFTEVSYAVRAGGHRGGDGRGAQYGQI